MAGRCVSFTTRSTPSGMLDGLAALEISVRRARVVVEGSITLPASTAAVFATRGIEAILRTAGGFAITRDVLSAAAAVRSTVNRESLVAEGCRCVGELESDAAWPTAGSVAAELMASTP